MELRLGRHAFDVGTRGLVVAQVTGLGQFEAAASERPDAVAVIPGVDGVEVPGTSTPGDDIARLVGPFGGPVGVRSGDASLIEAALSAGAAFVHDPTGLADPRTLSLIEEHDASVLIGAPDGLVDEAGFLDERAAWCRAAGIHPAGVVLVARDSAVHARLGADHHVAVEVGAGAEGWGTAAAALMDGARLVIAAAAPGRIRSIRRTVDTIGELLERRKRGPSPSAVAPAP